MNRYIRKSVKVLPLVTFCAVSMIILASCDKANSESGNTGIGSNSASDSAGVNDRADGGPGSGVGAGVRTDAATTESSMSESSSDVLDDNELTHLLFMREEEKLARDVYIRAGMMYPDTVVFGNIDNSEQSHTDAVKAMIEKYGYDDPSTNDNVGVYTGEDYGWYFTEKYQQLVAKASNSELDAYYVGAFIEELDMLDINQCPKVIVETDNGIDDVSECGKVYTTKSDIIRLYTNLLDGSKSHLRAYVQNIEQVTGEGSYEAQVLNQETVDEILGR